MPKNDHIDYLTGLFQGRYGLVVAAVRYYAPTIANLEDVVQQVYLEFVQGCLEEKWNLDADINPLLFQIAKRRAQNALRQHRREGKFRPLDELAEQLIAAPCEREDPTLDATRQKLEAMRRCLDKLPPHARSFVEQHYFNSVPMKEISKQQQKSESAVYRFFFRIRARLRQCILQAVKES